MISSNLFPVKYLWISELCTQIKICLGSETSKRHDNKYPLSTPEGGMRVLSKLRHKDKARIHEFQTKLETQSLK